MSHNAYGYLSGVVTKVEREINGNYTTLEVLASNGITCHASYDGSNPFPIEVGMKIELEEATVFFDNGRIDYRVDEDLEGVTINDVVLERFVQR